MPQFRTEQGKKNKYAYDAQYLKQFVKTKCIPFNIKNEEDMEMLEWIRAQEPSGNAYIKGLIREDMRQKKANV